jgi:SAM-dependent methyltransferase
MNYMKTKSLVYREKWQDPEFNKLFIGFKEFISASEKECAGQCAEIIAQHLPEQIRVLDLGAGDGTVSLPFLEMLSRHRQISSYTAIDISAELVKILNSKMADFKKYSNEVHFQYADATQFIPATRPHLIVAFSSWFGLPLSEISRYLSLLEPGGTLAITLSSKASITIDLTIQFVEPMRSSEDIIEWLEANKLPYTQHQIVSRRLERTDFVNGKDTQPKAETFFRYLLRRPKGSIGYVVPHLQRKPDLYFKTPKDLVILKTQPL